MKPVIRFFAFTIILISALAAFNTGSVLATSPEELQKTIDEKTKELKEINTQIQTTQGSLNDLGKQKQSLSKEVKKIDYNISQLNLGIRSSEINIQKTQAELDLLGDKKTAAEDGIEAKKKSITEVLRQMQRNDKDGITQMILKNSTLADSVSEIQDLQNLQMSLSDSAAELSNLRNQLAQTIDETDKTKKNLEKENGNLKNRKYILDDQKQEKANVLKLTKSQESVYQKQLSALEDKQQELDKVISDLEEKLRASFDSNLLPNKRPGVLGYPLQNPVMTQEYGATAFAQKAYKSKFHNGVDFGTPIGTPILAADDGKIIAVGNNDKGTSRWTKYQYGKYIVIQHDNNLASLYAHLSRQVVAVGDTVKKGDIIGYSGNTGYSTGAHLHFTVYWAPSIQFKAIPPAAGLVPIGVTINPSDYL
jgi:murein DD-endopeptidase MepM/ murein hydrolase activator NlpD